MAINEVIFEGETLMSTIGTTVSPETLAAGETAIDASGELITGVMTTGSGNPYAVLYTEQSLSEEQQAQARNNIGAYSFKEAIDAIDALASDIVIGDEDVLNASKKYTDKQLSAYDVVHYTKQTLSSEQQAQARANIEAASESQVESISASFSELEEKVNESVSAKAVYVDIHKVNDVYTSDMTVAEIAGAVAQGSPVYCLCNIQEDDLNTGYPLLMNLVMITDTEALFCVFADQLVAAIVHPSGGAEVQVIGLASYDQVDELRLFVEEQSKTIADGDANTLTSANSYADSILLDFMEDSFANLEGHVEEMGSSFTEHTSDKSNPHSVTKSQIGLGNVENKSSATIRSELTKAEIENALGYTVPTQSLATQTSAGLMSASDKVNLDETIPQRIDTKVDKSTTVNGKALTGNISLSASDVKADASGTASTAVSTHNTNTSAHNDIRTLISGLTNRLNALADSDDTTLDQMSEIVAYIKSNKSLIDSVTTSKVSVSDIINNLTTNVTNKPLSAAQGVAIKALIDALRADMSSIPAVLYTEQSLSSEQQAQARDNIGAYSFKEAIEAIDALASDIVIGDEDILDASKKYTDNQLSAYSAVRYTAQSLDSEQQAQARANIEAASENWAESISVGLSELEEKVEGQSKTIADGDADTLTSANLYADSILLGFMEDSFANLEGHVEEMGNSFTEHTSNKSNPHNVTKAQIGLGNVENKSSATIRSELTKDEVEKALGYTVPTQNLATQASSGLMSAADKTKLDGIATEANKYSLPTASSSTLGGVKVGSNVSISNGTISVPDASGTVAGVTIVYPAAQCTTFSSDNGTVTPLAVQKGAKQFAITRPASSTNKAITRYSNTTGDVQDSKIIIEDVTNTRDTSKTAQVIAIPAEGNKKMVYGYCTDQIDGTSFIGGVFDKSATTYPYNQGLAIGGTSGNLLWKGSKVAVTTDIPTKLPNPNKLTFTGAVSGSYDGSSATTINIPTVGGEKGDPGDDGVGITSVVQTTTSTTDGGNNVITVTLTDETKSTFTVKNGSKGSAGTNGTNGKDGVSPTVSVSKSGKVTTLTITDVNGTKTATINDGADGANGTGSSSIPDYVYAEAKAVATVVNRHQSEDSIVFPFLADAHCGYYTDTENAAAILAAQLLDCIGKRIPYDFVANGGDMATGAWNTTKDDSFKQIEDYTEIMGAACKGTPYIWTAGNHDDSPYMATNGRVTQTETFALIGRKNRLSGAICPNGCNYGYLDLDNRKLRVIYLDTDDKRSWGTVAVGSGETAPDYLNAHNISGEQLVWLANNALDFSSKINAAEWSIVVISHVPLNISSNITDAVSKTVYANSTENAAKILSAYKRGGSGSITHNGVSVSYNFSNLERASVICAIHGHNHKFTSETLAGNILSVGCPNVMNGRERVSDDGNTYTKTAGTANGTSFCIITIDRANCVLYADCVGVGYDREFVYTTEAIKYTNVIPISTDTDGSIYNGCGYKADTYISSGVIGSRTGIYTTGFIPVSGGDVIRFKNCTITKGENSHRFAFYDANKNYIAQAQMNSSAVLQQVYDGDNVTQITLASFGSISDWNQVAYMRFCCGYIGEDSIATVNEEITDDTETGGSGDDNSGDIPYTNLLPLSTDTNGSIYNKVGYAPNTYLSSSDGAVSTRTGYYTSGFIPCGVGTNYIVRFKNITFDYDGNAPTYDRIAVYDSNKNFLGMINAANALSYGSVTIDESGIWESFYFKNTISNVDITSMAYFRFCCTYIGEDSIVTINEEIEDSAEFE